MSLADSSALWLNRLQANAPQISTLGYSQAYNFGLSLLSAFEDGQYLVTQSAPNISVLSAVGPALDLIGFNYGVFRSQGTAAALLMQFSVSAAPTLAAIVIPPGTVVGTIGDNISTFQQLYSTQGYATISIGSTTSNVVLGVAQVSGTASNVASGSVTLIQQGIAGVMVTNNPTVPVSYPVPTSYTVPDANGQILGTDPDTDGIFRARIIAAITLKYGTTAINSAIQAVVMPEQLTALGDTSKHNYAPFTSYVYDPQNGSGFIYYAWALLDGTAPGLPGGATTSTGDGVTYVNLGATVLSDMALAVDTAVRAVAPVNTVPRIFAAGSVTSPFSLVAVTTMTCKFTVPTSVTINTSTFNDPNSLIIKQGVINYIQSLQYNSPPTVGGASQYVISYCANFSLPVNNFALTVVNGTNITTGPAAAGSATVPILYRCTAGVGGVTWTISIGYL